MSPARKPPGRKPTGRKPTGRQQAGRQQTGRKQAGGQPAGRQQTGRKQTGASQQGRKQSARQPSRGEQGRARPPQTKLVPTRSTQRRIGVDRSRGAGRVGGTRATPGDPYKRSERGLGGEQVEGRHAVRELLIAGGRKVHEVWISSELIDDDAVADIVEIAKANKVPLASVARGKLDARARSEAPQGVIAFAAELAEADFGAALRGSAGRPPFLVAVDGVTDPGNLGAILRSCEGAGVDAVVLPKHRAVHVTPTVAKAAAGAVEHVPLALVSGLPTAINQMRKRKIWVVGLDDAADRSLFEIDDLATEGICLVLGAEGAGLSRLVRERCDLVVGIPMLGRLSSLNVSAAAALATYEVARHRTG